MDINKDLTILVCCHKQDYCHKGSGFLPIQVGKALSNIDLGIQGDDTGDNISALNPYYCELTAHYWFWKNGVKTKYVGLNHYRRYFDFNNKIKWGREIKIFSEQNITSDILNVPDLNALFEDSDIIIARPTVYHLSVEDEYRRCHIDEDLQITKSVIEKKYPEYLDAYTKYIEHNNKLSHYNMFLTRYEIFNDYSSWLFDILNEVRKQNIISMYPAQKRVFGYLAERLMNVYIEKNNLKVKYLPVIKIDSAKNESLIKQKLLEIRNNFIFLLLGKKTLGR